MNTFLCCILRYESTVCASHVEIWLALRLDKIHSCALIHWLQVLTFPLLIDLMTHPRFPYPLLGSVHARTEIVQHKSIRYSERVDVIVGFAGSRYHRRGTEVDFLAQIRSSQGGALLWECTTTILCFHSHPSKVNVNGDVHRRDWTANSFCDEKATSTKQLELGKRICSSILDSKLTKFALKTLQKRILGGDTRVFAWITIQFTWQRGARACLVSSAPSHTACVSSRKFFHSCCQLPQCSTQIDFCTKIKAG